jgi:hypothetical protein
MMSIGKWPQNYDEHRKMATEGMQSIAKKEGMQSVAKWPENYAEHRKMAKKLCAA